jgi:hypothetical protein
MKYSATFNSKLGRRSELPVIFLHLPAQSWVGQFNAGLVETLGKSTVLFSRLWPITTIWRGFSAATHCAENILRLQSADCNADYVEMG